MDRLHHVSLPRGGFGWRQGLIGAGALGLAAALGLFLQTKAMEGRLLRAAPGALPADHALMAFARGPGRRVYQTHCAACHGVGGKGDQSRAAPDLTDADWLYGEGDIGDIEALIAHGVRAHAPRTFALADMPAYAHARPSLTEPIPPLSPGDIADMTQYVVLLSGRSADAAAAARGALIYQGRGGCYDCHGRDGGGDSAIGAPRLTDAIWLYGGTRADIAWTLSEGRHGVSPAFAGRLSPLRIREAAIYVWGLSHRAAGG